MAWSSVGVVRRVKVCSAWPMRMVLRQMVARSASRSGRVCAGYPVGVVALLDGSATRGQPKDQDKGTTKASAKATVSPCGRPPAAVVEVAVPS